MSNKVNISKNDNGDLVFSDNIKQRLILDLGEQLKYKERSGIYSYISKSLAYNSNKIEGTSLTLEHTESLFNYGYIQNDNQIISNELEEMSGHFLMFNYAITNLNLHLNIDYIKKLHYELKIGVFRDRLNGYAIGDFKTRPNIIGNQITTHPNKVEKEMSDLVKLYISQEVISLEVLAKFHLEYEKIHPFQDGNGRTGRLIIFIEALKNNIVPPIIRELDRDNYLKSLKDNNINDLTLLLQESQTDLEDKIKYFYDY